MSLQSSHKVWSYFANSKTNKRWLSLEEEIMAILKKNIGSNAWMLNQFYPKKYRTLFCLHVATTPRKMWLPTELSVSEREEQSLSNKAWNPLINLSLSPSSTAAEHTQQQNW